MEIDESAYAAAAREYDCRQARAGLLAWCQAEAGGDEAGARARYIAARAREMGGGRTHTTRTLAESFEGSPQFARPTPYPAAAHPRDQGSTWGKVLAGTVALVVAAFVVQGGVPEGLKPIAKAGLVAFSPRPPNPVVVRSTCDRERPDFDAETAVGLAVNVADHLLFKDATAIMNVTVRNSGASGEIDVVAVFEQDREPYVTERRETVYLEAGEQRDLEFVFPELVAAAQGACQVAATLPGASVAGL